MRRIVLLTLALLALSCTRDPIMDEVSKYRFGFAIDSDVLYCAPADPELVQVIFYDPETGKKIEETYLSPEGGYLYSIEPGRYDIVAFTMGSSRTEITYTKDLNLLTAETKTIQTSPSRIINSPDHVFAGVVRSVDIPCLSQADPEFVLSIPMKSVCDSWKVTVSGVKGLQYAASAYVCLSGQARDILLKDMTPEGDCTIRCEGTVDLEGNVIGIPFCTFGMNEGKTVTLKVVIEGQDRSVHTREYDITEQVGNPQNTTHAITVDFPVELHPMTQGGLDPSADPWDENHEFIDIK